MRMILIQSHPVLAYLAQLEVAPEYFAANLA